MRRRASRFVTLVLVIGVGVAGLATVPIVKTLFGPRVAFADASSLSIDTVAGGLGATTAVNNAIAPMYVATDAAGNVYASDSDNTGGGNRIVKVTPSGAMSTIAGRNATWGFSGDGGPAADADLNFAHGLAVDGTGNVYIADTGNDRVRKVSTTGTITTFAGRSSTCGYSGDGGPATNASLCGPWGLAVDSSGNLYISEDGNQRVRKVTPAGIITTFAGNGTEGFSGDGGPATQASLDHPYGLAAGPAGIYIADNSNNRVRLVSPSGIITTVAGNGGLPGFSGDGGPATQASLCDVFGVAADTTGNFYIGDGNNRVREVNTAGTINTVAGVGPNCTSFNATFAGDGGPATSAHLNGPNGISFNQAGDMVIADEGNFRIRTVSGGIINTIAGDGTAGYAGDGGPGAQSQLYLPVGLATDTVGAVFIADSRNARVRAINTTGTINTVAGGGTLSGDGVPATQAMLRNPVDVAVDNAGNVVIVDGYPGNRVRMVAPNGTITTVAGTGTTGYSGDGGPATLAQLNSPIAATVDSAANVFIADEQNWVVRKVNASGVISTFAGTGAPGYSGDGGPATQAKFSALADVLTDSMGDLYIADSGNNRIRKVDSSGTITTVVGNGTAGFAGDGGLATQAALNGPSGLALDSVGDLFIADANNNRIREVFPSGIITTVAGTGVSGFSGDGGPATQANFATSYSHASLAIDPAGNLYLPDMKNDRVRKIAGIAPPVAQPPVGAITIAELAGPSDPSVLNQCRVCVAKPVDTASGNQFESRTDLTVSGRGMPLRLGETYNTSFASTNGPLGFGWNWSYGISLTNPDGSVLGSSPTMVRFNQETGSRETFDLSGSTWTPSAPRVNATLTHNADGTWTLVRGRVETLQFNTAGSLTGDVDLNGVTTSISYPSSSTIVVTDPAGRALTATLDAGSSPARITQVADSSTPPRVVQFRYDANGNLGDIVDVNGGDTSYGYDASHRLVLQRTPRFYAPGSLPAPPTSCASTPPANIAATIYDANGRVLCQWDADGRKTTFAWTDDGQGDGLVSQAIVTDPKGNATLYGYTYGELTSKTEGYGTSQAATWTYRYDPNTLGMIWSSDPNGHITTATYNSHGERLTQSDPLGRTATWTYNSNDEIASVTPPATYGGQTVTTTYAYDEAAYSSGGIGNLTTVSTPVLSPSGVSQGTQVTRFVHSDSTHPGDVTGMIDPLGNTWGYTYDSYGDKISTSAPATSDNSDGPGSRSNVTKWSYNTNTGWLTAALSGRYTLAHPNDTTCTPPATGCTTFTHDNMGRVLLATDGNAHTTTSHYDTDGNRDYTIDGNNRQTTFTYDAAEQLTVTTRADTTAVRTSYWPDGTIEDQIDASGADTHYAYDALGHVTTITDPNSRVTTFTYDAVGNLLVKGDPGVSGCMPTSTTFGCVTYAYDAAGEAIAIHYNDAAHTPDVTNVLHDGNGRRTAMTDGSGTSIWSRDSLGRIVSTTSGSGATIGYVYDLRSEQTSVTYPGSAGAVTRHYDPAGRVDSMQDWNSNQTTCTYDADGNLATSGSPATGGTPVVDTFTFDPAGAVSNIASTHGANTLNSFSYGRDGVNQETSITSTGVPADTHAYGYNSLEQLTTVDGNSVYGYDHADNPTLRPSNTAQTFDSANQLLSGGPSPATYGNAPTLDRSVSANQTSAATHLTSPALSTTGPNELIVALISADGPKTSTQSISSVTGGGLTWSLIARANAQQGTAEVWQAYASSALANATVTANFGSTSFDGAIVVAAFTGAAAKAGASAIGSAASGAPGVTLTTTKPGSLIWGTGTDPSAATARSVDSGQTIINQSVDTGAKKTFWSQSTTSAVASAGTAVAFGDSAPTADKWNLAAVEITPAGTGGGPSFGIDHVASTHQTPAAPSIVSPPISTSANNELLIAFIDADGSSHSTQSISTVTGGGLTWSRIARANAQQGTAEIWSATSANPLTNATITANLAVTSFDAAITVVAFTGAGVGVTGNASGASGAPSVALTTTRAGSLVWSAGNDPTAATTRTPNTGQTIVDQFVDSTRAFWTQASGATGSRGSIVTAGDAAPTADKWNLAAVEITPTTSTAYEYDPKGERTAIVPPTGSVTALAYDQAGRLITYGSATYQYNGDGIRVAKTVGGSTTSFTYDAINGLPQLLQQTVGTATTSYGYGPAGSVLEDTTAGTTRWYHHDALDSTRTLTDSSGNVLATFTYDAYGSTTATTGTATTPFGWAGEYKDSESGFTYLRARYYDPGVASFLTRDPADAVTRAAYGYVANNPLNAVDPSGLDGWGCWENVCLSDGLKGLANFAAGFANAGVGIVTLGHVHIKAPFCGPGLGASYGIGGTTAQVEIALAGGLKAPEVEGAAATSDAAAASDAASQASTKWGRTIEDFKANPDSWERVSAHAEPATGGAYEGGLSVEEVYSNGNDTLVRHTIYDATGDVLHQTFRPFGKFGAG